MGFGVEDLKTGLLKNNRKIETGPHLAALQDQNQASFLPESPKLLMEVIASRVADNKWHLLSNLQSARHCPKSFCK